MVKIEMEMSVNEHGGSCTEDDIMVEVFGSQVYVNGTCTSDGDAGVNPNNQRDDSGDGSIESSCGADNFGLTENLIGEGGQRGEDMIDTSRHGSVVESVKKVVGTKNSEVCNWENGSRVVKLEKVCVTEVNEVGEGRGLSEMDLEQSLGLVDHNSLDFEDSKFFADSMEVEQASTTETVDVKTPQVFAAEGVRSTNGVDHVPEINDVNLNELAGTLKDRLLKTGNGAAHTDYSRALRDIKIEKQEPEPLRDLSAGEAARGLGEGAEYNILFDPNFDVSTFIDFAGIISCPGNFQPGKAEGSMAADELEIQLSESVDEVARMDDSVVPISTVELQRSMGRGQESMSNEVLNEECSEPFLASCQLPLDNEDGFSVSDLVWAKRDSLPWWPGQVCDPSDASEEAMKYYREGCFLVAFFRDGAFAWKEASSLKHFRMNFPQMEKQSNGEAFKSAVSYALEEVSRWVGLGLACSCLSNDAYNRIQFQRLENCGMQQESRRLNIRDKFAGSHSFRPNKLVEYVKALAVLPAGGFNHLELAIAKAQLLAFSNSSGYYHGSLQENDINISEHGSTISKDDEVGTLDHQMRSYCKRKHNLKDGLYGGKKQRTLSEFMGEIWDSLADGTCSAWTGDYLLSNERKSNSLAKVSISTAQLQGPTSSMADCIHRTAGQMAGSPLLLNNSLDCYGLPIERLSLGDLLLQLHSSALDPLGGCSPLNNIISFFSDFRNSVVLNMNTEEKSGGTITRSSDPVGAFAAFEFDNFKDTYWTDRVIANGCAEELSGGKIGYQVVPVELKPVMETPTLYRTLRNADSSHNLGGAKSSGSVDENAPAELIMNFPETDQIPSEMKLNKMFRHFGRIIESRTEVDKVVNRARVVFKKCSDAEVAFNSAGKFSIFGPVAVGYQLNHAISEPFKTSLFDVTIDEEDTPLCQPSQI